MTKYDLISFIERYSLDGKIHAVKWTIKDHTLTVQAGSLHFDGDYIAHVTYRNVPGEDLIAGIMSGADLITHLKCLDDSPITIAYLIGDLDKSRLVIFNDNLQIQYMVADLENIPRERIPESLPKKFVEIKLTTRFLYWLHKTRESLNSVSLLAFVPTVNGLSAIIGYDESRPGDTTQAGSKLEYQEYGDTITRPLYYKLAALDSICRANRDVITDSVLKVSSGGLAWLELVSGDITCKYLLRYCIV